MCTKLGVPAFYTYTSCLLVTEKDENFRVINVTSWCHFVDDCLPWGFVCSHVLSVLCYALVVLFIMLCYFRYNQTSSSVISPSEGGKLHIMNLCFYLCVNCIITWTYPEDATLGEVKVLILGIIVRRCEVQSHEWSVIDVGSCVCRSDSHCLEGEGGGWCCGVLSVLCVVKETLSLCSCSVVPPAAAN